MQFQTLLGSFQVSEGKHLCFSLESQLAIIGNPYTNKGQSLQQGMARKFNTNIE